MDVKQRISMFESVPANRRKLVFDFMEVLSKEEQ